MKDELRPLGDGLLVDLVWKDLVEIIRLKLLVLISVPQPGSRLHAFHVFLLDLDLSLSPSLQLEDIVTHLYIIFSLHYNYDCNIKPEISRRARTCSCKMQACWSVRVPPSRPTSSSRTGRDAAEFERELFFTWGRLSASLREGPSLRGPLFGRGKS